jgi:hypothetical protein
MSSPPDTNNADIVGSAPLYSRPQPLNPEQHGKLGLKSMPMPWGFAAHQHFVPLLLGEFAPAALSYPIIFAGDQLTPLAVMGINPGDNLFFEADGSVRPDAYLPAYVRRYPFTVANDTALGRMVVCVDVDSYLVVENPDHPFFDTAGEPTDYTKRCIAFCQDYDTERARTDAFVQALKDMDLFEEREAKHTPTLPDGSAGEPVTVATYTAISETKLNALPDDKFLELRATGALGLAFVHLASLNGWDKLINLAIAKSADKAAAAPTAANA